MTTDREPDEHLWELDITACDDGGILLSQGPCWSCHEAVPVRLHRSHLPLLAEAAGWITHNEFQHRTESLRDRLSLLAAMVRAHCPDGHPLRAAADELVGRSAKPSVLPAVNADQYETSVHDDQPQLF